MKIQIHFIFFIIAIFGLLPILAWSNSFDNALITDRPDVAESSQTVGQGNLQLETSIGYSQDRIDGRRIRNYTFPTLLRYGWTDTVELRLGSDIYTFERIESPAESTNGTNDIELGIKWQFYDGDGEYLPSAAVIPFINLPTGSSRFSSDKAEPGLTVAMDWDLPYQFELGANWNITYAVNDNQSGNFWQFNGAWALGRPVTDRLGWFIELFGSFPANEHNGNAISIDSGLKYLITPDQQIDFAVTKGLTDEADSFQATIGYSIRFNKI